MSRSTQRYQHDPMLTASDVYYALMNRRYTSDPEYVKGVIRNYVHFKAQRGKSKFEIALKLEPLEREFGQFAYAFRAVRLEYSLPPSRILPAPATTSNINNLRRTQTAAATASSPIRNTSAITRTNTTVGATTNRPVQQNNDDEPPPPPYQSQDPDPDATRALQESLAAEAERNGTLLSQSVSTPTTANTNTSISQASPRISSSSSSRPIDPPRSPITEGPERIPSDPELARIWEESQFEEAKRASLAYQVEQQELQEAMRLSLADPISSPNGAGGVSSNSAGPSHSHPINTIPENQSSRENINFNVEMDDLIDDVEDLNIPGPYNPDTASTPTPSSASPSNVNQSQNLLDEQPTSSYSGQTPLTPQKTGFHIQSKNPFLSSNEKEQLQAMEEAALTTPTSEHFRSPSFTSPGSSYTQYNAPNSQPTSQHRQSFSSIGEPGSSHTLYSPPANPPETYTHAQQHTPPPLNAGSSYTHYTPPSNPIPSEPSQQLYTPPSGPPPAHLRVVTPASPTSRPLPATPKDQFPWDEPSSPRIAFPQPITTPTASSASQASFSSPIAEIHNSLHQTLQGTPPRLPARKKTFVPPPGKEDALETLRDFDTVFLVDDSTSMAGDRWSEARQALMEVAEIAARYDENGVDIYFLNSKRVGKELRAAHEVEDLFRGLKPKGATPTGMRLESILREYMAKLERSQSASPISNGHSESAVKPMNLIVVTDGVFAHPVISRKRHLESDPSINHLDLLATAPTDDPESVLIACAKRLDRGEFPLSQVGVQFLQIGNDSEAREALQELDDGLSSVHGIRDIVDTVPYTGEDVSAGLIIKTLLGGINRRLDRRSSA